MTEHDRYQRQIMLPGVGAAGQRALAESHVAVVGVGALGTVAADLLVRAGVGRVTCIDRDLVERSNLQRQTLFVEADVGEPKAVAAAARLRATNSGVEIVPVVVDVVPSNAGTLLAEADLLLDGTDNFETRYLMNDVAVSRRIPLVYGGAVGWGGSQMTVLPGETACLRCIEPRPPAPGAIETCDTAGVFGPVSAIVACAEAASALRVLMGRVGAAEHGLLAFDIDAGRRTRTDARALRDPGCVCCGRRRFEFLDGLLGRGSAERLCGRLAVQIPAPEAASDLATIATRLRASGTVEQSAFFVRGAFRERPAGFEADCIITVFADGRAIVSGTDQTGLARSVYARAMGH